MRSWNYYESHKTVQAARICEVVDVGGTLHVMVKPYDDDHTVERFEPTLPDMVAHAEVGGYAVLYNDGYKSISPQKPFEDGYIRKHGEQD